MSNLIDKQNEAKYRRIRRQAKGFHKGLGHMGTSAFAALSAVGFSAITEPSGEQVLLAPCKQLLTSSCPALSIVPAWCCVVSDQLKMIQAAGVVHGA
jgi:hypothetical protein